MNPNSLNRRAFLRGAGAILGLPALEALTPVTAFAQSTPDRPLRMAFCFVPNGVHMGHWRPESAGNLGDFPATLKPLEAYKQHLNVLTGLTQKNAFALGDGPGDHARSSAVWLTGVHPRKTSGENIQVGISADQLAAKYLKEKTRFASLELGCERGGLSGDCDSGYSCAYSNSISWTGPSTPNAKETRPRAVFERLFGSIAAHEDAAAAAKRRRLEHSVLDYVLEEADSLQQRLSQRDRMKLDEYLTSVRDIERRLVAMEKGEGRKVVVGQAPTTPEDFGEHIRLMGDMMVLAFQADLTRVCTLMFANEGSNRSYRQIGISDGHHEISHHGKDEAKLAKKRAIDEYHTLQLAYILKRLKETDDLGAPLLERTMLVYGGGISDGDRHNHDDLPILFAGGDGKAFRTGRHIVYENGTPMGNLLISMLDRMGIRGETLGDATGPLPGLF